jgi:hypothetical protein
VKYFRFMLLAIAWIICAIWFYVSVVNIVVFVNFPALNLPKIGISTLNGILAVNLIASVFSFLGLSLSTFNKSPLQKSIGFRRLLIVGVCMFPVVNLIELASSNFLLTRYFWTSFAVSICISLIIALAISTAWRNKLL